MKGNKRIFNYHLIFFVLFSFTPLFPQKIEGPVFSAGADFYSSYLFRGTQYGSAPSIQPVVKMTVGSLTAGGWGSFDFSGYQEADLFFSFTLPGGFAVGMTDYYYPGQDYFEFSNESGSHAFEINAGYTGVNLALSANIVLNEAGGALSSGRDLYFQAGFNFSGFNIIAGAGNGWHTSDGRFALCNIAIGTVRKITVTDSFVIPVTGQIIFNPERERLYVVAGITL